MSRSKTQPKTVTSNPYVAKGDVFKTFIEQGASLANEVNARRIFDEDVALYLKERELTVDFEQWRKIRNDV